MSDARIELSGASELIADFNALADNYYNEGYNAMRRVGTQFKRELREKVRSKVKTDVNLTKGFWTSQPHGSKGSELYIEFAGETSKTNPHWHLIEEGHVLKRPRLNRFKKPYSDAGATIGHVAGIHSVDEFERSGRAGKIVEEQMAKTLDKALSRSNLK